MFVKSLGKYKIFPVIDYNLNYPYSDMEIRKTKRSFLTKIFVLKKSF